MTTEYQEQFTCAICHSVSEQTKISSSNEFGSADFDSRPPEMIRSTIYTWIQRCPSCGYCAADISKESGKATEHLTKEAYKKQLVDDQYSELANSFLCSSLLSEYEGNHVDAGWSALNAAWVCDDADANAPARNCRMQAALFFEMAMKKGDPFAENRDYETLILADVLRRAGEFERTIKLCGEYQKDEMEDWLMAVLLNEIMLSTDEDDSCHNLDEVLAKKPS